MLYLRVWQGDETDWVTLTPDNPDMEDSENFDEGQCTGFYVKHSTSFVTELLALCNRYGVTVNNV